MCGCKGKPYCTGNPTGAEVGVVVSSFVRLLREVGALEDCKSNVLYLLCEAAPYHELRSLEHLDFLSDFRSCEFFLLNC